MLQRRSEFRLHRLQFWSCLDEVQRVALVDDLKATGLFDYSGSETFDD